MLGDKPFVFIDTPLGTTQPLLTIAQNPYKGGYCAGRIMRMFQGSGKFACIRMYSSGYNLRERIRGFTDFIQRDGNSTVLDELYTDFSDSGFYSFMKDLFEKHNDIKDRLRAILGDKKLLLGVIRDELNEIAEKYGDDRRSRIEIDMSDINIEDLVPNDNVVIARTELGYIKRMTMDNFHVQNRGGRGIKGIQTIDKDNIEDLLMTSNHSYVLFLTNKGRVYRLKTYEIPEGSRTSRGTAIVNLLDLMPGEKIAALIPLTDYIETQNLFMVTKKGIVKKTPIMEYQNIRRKGLIAINLREDDELIEVKQTNNDSHIFIVTKNGMCIRFKETDLRPLGRASQGVTGIKLRGDDEVVGMQIDTQGDSLLIVSEKGMGKRSALEDFRLQKRAGLGLKCYKITEKTGKVMGVKAVTDEQEIMMITTAGIIIRIRMSDIRTMSRITSGVKLINLAPGVTVAKIAKVRAEEEDEDAEYAEVEDADEAEEVEELEEAEELEKAEGEEADEAEAESGDEGAEASETE